MLKGQRALITGAGRGIGEAIARRFAAARATLFITARSRNELERVAHEVGAEFDVCDVTVPEQVEAIARKAGPVTILVNNAGIAEGAPLHQTDLAMWRRAMDTNATSAFLFCRAIVPGMKERKFGRIINVASMAGKRGASYISAYAASKHALIGLTTSLAEELAESGIKVNAVCPGYVETPMTEKNMTRMMSVTGRSRDDLVRSILSKSGQARLIQPAEVAEAALNLAAPGCPHNGEAIDV